MWVKSSKCEGGSCVEVNVNWVKSTKCEQGACVEVAWDKSTKCDTNACVEVATVGEDLPTVGVRNSRLPGEVVWFDRDEWTAFIAGVKAGEFDI